MLPLDINLTDEDEAELDRITAQVGAKMWRELGLLMPPAEMTAPGGRDTAPTGDALRALEMADLAEMEARRLADPHKEPTLDNDSLTPAQEDALDQAWESITDADIAASMRVFDDDDDDDK